jgi:hypothetical protein
MLLLDSAVFDAVIDWMANGIMGFSGWQIFFVILGLTHITIASVTIFLHRHQAHRALDLQLISQVLLQAKDILPWLLARIILIQPGTLVSEIIRMPAEYSVPPVTRILLALNSYSMYTSI